jgi:hypothetical protein
LLEERKKEIEELILTEQTMSRDIFLNFPPSLPDFPGSSLIVDITNNSMEQRSEHPNHISGTKRAPNSYREK